jgi:hypothetical protein
MMAAITIARIVMMATTMLRITVITEMTGAIMVVMMTVMMAVMTATISIIEPFRADGRDCGKMSDPAGTVAGISDCTFRLSPQDR